MNHNYRSDALKRGFRDCDRVVFEIWKYWLLIGRKFCVQKKIISRSCSKLSEIFILAQFAKTEFSVTQIEKE